MAKMTKPQLRKHAALYAAIDRTRTAVYESAPNRVTPLSKCLEMATPDVAAAYESAVAALRDFESQMISEGRAYRGALRTFYPNP